MNEITGKKMGMTIRLTEEAAHEFFWAERFPRRHRTVTHKITKADREAYDALKARWTAAKAEWEAVMEEASAQGLSYWGWREDDPEFGELEPRVDYIYEETEEEWRDRVKALVAHHRETGEWLEEPRKTISDMFAGSFTERL